MVDNGCNHVHDAMVKRITRRRPRFHSGRVFGVAIISCLSWTTFCVSGFVGNGITTRPVSGLSSTSLQSSTKSSSSKASERKQKQALSNDSEWAFFDTARMHVSGGQGGNGCVAFRREKGEARGGPSGGRGGNGGSVVLVCSPKLNTLAHIRQKVHVRASPGKNGTGKNRDGKHAEDIEVMVPPGTIIRELHTERVAGELSEPGQRLVVAQGGRGGRGNAAFMTARNTGPKLAERGEPGAKRWLAVELRLVADVGFIGKPNAGKSTLLAAASAARPKIANYPFTTVVPNLGVCDLLDENDGSDTDGDGLVLCDIPGLIEGAAEGAGLGQAFLRHVQRCRALVHVIDGSSEDPLEDFRTIQRELEAYDNDASEALASLVKKPQVVVINKVDLPSVKETYPDLVSLLEKEAGHTRILPISAATRHNVRDLMRRLRTFVRAVSSDHDVPPPVPQVDLSATGLDADPRDFTVVSDPAYPGQWRISGDHIERVALMTHWEYPEAVARFGRQLMAIGIADELLRRGAQEGDLVMVDKFDFEFTPSGGGGTNLYIPQELLEADAAYQEQQKQQQQPRGMLLTNDLEDDDDFDDDDFRYDWRTDDDTEELDGFSNADEWEMLEFSEDSQPVELDEDFDVEEGDDIFMY